MPGGKRNADDQRCAAFEERKPQHGDNSRNAKRFCDVAKPVEIVLNILPIYVHTCRERAPAAEVPLRR